MSEYFSYAQFVSCNDLIDFQNINSPNYHKFKLKWFIPSTNLYLYDRIELYRYIGPYMSCIDPDTIVEGSPNGNCFLIQSKKQSFTNTGEYKNEFVTENRFPIPNITTTTGIITGYMDFEDDFTKLNPNFFNLDDFHKLPGKPNNSDIINDIGFTRRPIYYIVKTYIKGVFDNAPYLCTPDYVNKTLSNHSTKTQVKHNYLHYEGDEMWQNILSEAANDENGGISRTAIDINRLYLDALQQGPTGRGGYAWVSDRSTGKVFQLALKNGGCTGIFKTGTAGRGHGIAINLNTGDCISTPGDTDKGTVPKLFICESSKAQGRTPVNATPKIENLGGRIAYGVLPLFGNPDKFIITSFIDSGPARLYTISTNSIENLGVVVGYAGSATPNGYGIQADNSGSYVYFFNANAKTTKSLNLTLGDISKTNNRLSTDNFNLFPNTIFNSDKSLNEKRNYFSMVSNNEFGLYVPSPSQDWTTPIIYYSIKLRNTGTPGYDGENNLWHVNSKTKQKYYRTAHNRGKEEQNIYPYGGESRYPAVPINQWPLSLTNDQEIEWFLTRNHGLSTLDYLNNGFNSNKVEIDPSTLDNTEIVTNWHTDVNGNLLTGTAYTAWWSIIDNRNLRINYPSQNYFYVWNAQGIDTNAKKWGIRMSVLQEAIAFGVNTSQQKNIDDYYEKQSNNWKPYIKAKIRAWYNAFANSETAYLNVPNREELIQNNIKGLKVHPFWSRALDGASNYSINQNAGLTDEQKYQIQIYAQRMKYYNFGSLTYSNLYMYSDFTGNILSAGIESSPLNKDRIAPQPKDPSITMFVSGHQSNPGYQDTPAYCYPWKNTIPQLSLLSSFVSAVTGYDDFNATFYVSADMGSYLLTSFALSTDDFMPSYLTDIGNQDVLVLYKNLTYRNDNNYSNTAIFDYTYHSPSKNGYVWINEIGTALSANNLRSVPQKSKGYFAAKTNQSVKNLYEFNGSSCEIINISAQSFVTVVERWPEPRFYIYTLDSASLRQQTFCRNAWGNFSMPGMFYRESRTADAKRYDTIYGVDPLSANILDRSIGRTWPVSSWHLSLSTNNYRIGWTNNTRQFTVTSNQNLTLPQDEQNFFDSISSAIFRYGDYVLTMNVQTSTTSTSSDKLFTNYIKVSEFEPYANFWAIKAKTVPSNFTLTNTSITGSLIDIPSLPNATYSTAEATFNAVTGYAPNLTVWFQDSSEAHTFPIESYHWNFGDPYNEGPDDITSKDSNYYTITNKTSDITNGTFNNPCWNTTSTAHTAVHTYIMPGTYDVTLTVKASETNTQNVCARYDGSLDEKHFYVYVKEIPPVCNQGIFASLSSNGVFSNTASSVSGAHDTTIYFHASSIIAGSFPICRIDWDFGDGTIEKITRIPKTSTTSQGLSVINISAYVYDLLDPRNLVVPHTYFNTSDSNKTYDIHLSAYACNTNTLVHCSAFNLVSPIKPKIESRVIDTKRLIGSRFDESGNIIYMIEGEQENTIYTVVLSGER